MRQGLTHARLIRRRCGCCAALFRVHHARMPDPDPVTPQDLREAVELAITLLRAGRAAEAETLLVQLRERHPRDGDVLNLSGIAARYLGRGEDALRLTAAAVEVDPESGLFHANHGAALALAGMKQQAVAAYEIALRLRPDNASDRRNLGVLLAGLGHGTAALPQLRRAVELAPEDPETHVALARALHEAGDMKGAGEATARALLLLPEDQLAEEARFIASIAAGQVPARAPGAYLRSLFDAYADTFDQHLTGTLGYRTPEHLATLLGSVVPAERQLAVLDLGCGTGLSGAVLKPFARHMVGLDLSPGMLARARDRKLYDALHEVDLMDWLPTQPPESFDLACAADVLIYLGHLVPLFTQVARVLTPGGYFLLSIEDQVPGAAGHGTVGAGLRYQHDPAIALADAGRCGFKLVARDAATLRAERGHPVHGTLLLLSKD
jgi:predicted TPR repeat methyltransferase